MVCIILVNIFTDLAIAEAPPAPKVTLALCLEVSTVGGAAFFLAPSAATGVVVVAAVGLEGAAFVACDMPSSLAAVTGLEVDF